MTTFKTLYYFSCRDFEILEIKRIDLPHDAVISDIYKWLIISNKSKQVFEFDFKSMHKGDTEESRSFLEGEFRFDASTGNLSLMGRDITFERRDTDKAPNDVLNAINTYLTQSFTATESYSFRSLRPSDLHYFQKWLFDKEVIRYSMTKFHRLTKASEIADWFFSTLFDSKTFQLGMIDPVSKKLIGYAGISALNEIDGNGEYFIFIGDKAYWGRGIATHVTKEITRMGFQNLNLHRIFLTASSSNPGAIRAYEKAGFIHEGRMREAFFRNDQYSDKVIMGILRKEL